MKGVNILDVTKKNSNPINIKMHKIGKSINCLLLIKYPIILDIVLSLLDLFCEKLLQFRLVIGVNPIKFIFL